MGKRLRIDITHYLSSLNLEIFIDQINYIEKYFEFEEIIDLESVRLIKT